MSRRIIKSVRFGGISALALSMVLGSGQVAAQTTPTQEEPAQGDNARTPEIVVTANRRSERLIDVPASVVAVTAEEVDDLKLFKAEDIEQLAPGLELTRPDAGMSPSIALRGIETPAGLPSNAELYFNEVAQNIQFFLGALYDVGQLEVLRGPQGTLRGQSSPSGAITLTTRRPDLDDFGGYAQFAATSRNAINAQTGISVPLVPGKLAVRLAGLLDDTDHNLVRSVNGPAPYSRTKSGRATFLARPIDSLEIVATYQYMRIESAAYTQVVGPGNGINGPAIESEDRLAVGRVPARIDQYNHIAVLQATLDLPFDASLIYTGGYQDEFIDTFGSTSPLNTILNDDRAPLIGGFQKYRSHELRIQSNGGDLLDYVFGLYYRSYDSFTLVDVFNRFPGAVGVGGGYPSGPINEAYVLYLPISVRNPGKQKAVYGSVTVHATDKLDLTGGVRWMKLDQVQSAARPAATARNLVGAAANFGGSCPAAFGLIPSLYPGFCDFLVVLPASTSATPKHLSPVVYNASIKYAISDDLNVYATHGTSIRLGPTQSVLQPQGLPVLEALFDTPDERSTSYEVGLKGALFDRRVNFAVAVFQQDYNNFLTEVSAPYLSPNGISNTNVYIGADARVRGIEAELGVRPTDNFNFSLRGAYTKARFTNARIPCRDGNGDGVEDSLRPVSGVPGRSDENNAPGSAANASIPGALTLANPIAFCTTNKEVGDNPDFSATAQAELRAPIGSSEAYVRGLATYRSGRFNVASNFTTPDYALVNLYAGVRVGDIADISVYAKNLLDTDIETSRSLNEVAGFRTGVPGVPAISSGYRTTSRIAPREFGVSIRAAWGSR